MIDSFVWLELVSRCIGCTDRKTHIFSHLFNLGFLVAVYADLEEV